MILLVHWSNKYENEEFEYFWLLKNVHCIGYLSKEQKLLEHVLNRNMDYMNLEDMIMNNESNPPMEDVRWNRIYRPYEINSKQSEDAEMRRQILEIGNGFYCSESSGRFCCWITGNHGIGLVNGFTGKYQRTIIFLKMQGKEDLVKNGIN